MVEANGELQDANSELLQCYEMLNGIKNPLLRKVARQIFAPNGTVKPRPIDHAIKYWELPKDVTGQITKLGGLKRAFEQDEQAHQVLLIAVNRMHELYKAPPIGEGQKFSLGAALDQITAFRVTRGN